MPAQASSDRCAYVYDIRACAQPLAVFKGHTRAVSYTRFLGGDRLVTASTDGTLACWDLPRSIGSGCAGARLPRVNSNGSSSVSASSGGDGGSSGSSSSSLGSADFVATVAVGSPLKAAAGGWAGERCEALCVQSPAKLFTGHANQRLFTGLAVHPESGLLACGSESHSAYTYHVSWSQPLASYPAAAPQPRQPPGSCRRAGGDAPAEDPGRSRFVSAVAFQPSCAASAQHGHSLLAAAGSNGSVRLLTLAHADA